MGHGPPMFLETCYDQRVNMTYDCPCPAPASDLPSNTGCPESRRWWPQTRGPNVVNSMKTLAPWGVKSNATHPES